MPMRVCAAQSLSAGGARLRLRFMYLVTMLDGDQLAHLARTFLLALGLALLKGGSSAPNPSLEGGRDEFDKC